MKKPRIFLIIAALVSLMLACNLTVNDDVPTPVVVVVTQLVVADTATPQPTTIPTETTAAPEEPTVEPTIAATSTASAPVVTPLKDPVNCRYGPSIVWQQVYALAVGAYMPIVGRNADSSWWLVAIPNTDNKTCWVGASVTVTSGELSGIQVAPMPQAFITGVELKINPNFANVGQGCAVGPFPTFVVKGRIYANGPLEIAWQVQTQQDGFKEEHSITFKQFGYQDVSFSYVPSVWKKGKFWIRLLVTKPTTMAGDVIYEIACSK